MADLYYDDLTPTSYAASTSSLIRHASIRSARSHRSDDGSVSTESYTRQHRRNRSDASVISSLSYTGSDVVSSEDVAEGPLLFVTEPPKNLVCMVCDRVFKDPVIAKCGHTFCRMCVMNAPPGEKCPIHHVSLSKSNVISNLAVLDQIHELYIHCRYGCRHIEGTIRQFECDPNGCQETIKLGERRSHETTCDFQPTRCPNSLQCPRMLKRDLNTHLATCGHHPCQHKMRGCKFSGSVTAVEEHVKSCKYESIKGILLQSDATISSLKADIASKDQEIGFLRSMLAKLSERVSQMESKFEQRIDGLDENLTRLSADFSESVRQTNDLSTEMSNIQSKLGLVGDLDLVSSTHLYKCKGTFVGHQGPVWALAVHTDVLFSGSSDETIKVWDTGHSFKCKRTLQGHRGIVHTLCIHGHQLYSGSSDHTIKVWDVDSLEELHTLSGHENPVCTLAAANGLLFSGSLKIVKVWDLRTFECVGELKGLNHWVRALVATDDYVFAGSYQTISIWSSKRSDILNSDHDAECQHVLHTSGGSVYSLCATSRYVVCGTYENLIHVWDLETYTEMDTLEGHAGTVYALAFMPMGDQSQGRLFSASYDKTIRVWSLETFTCLQTLVRHENSVDALVVQRGRLFSGAADSAVKVWQ